MDTRVKKLWCDALRSGEYTQCTNQLCKDGRHCCLGVLTDLYLDEHTEDGKTSQHLLGKGESGGLYISGVLNETVMEWAGLDAVDPRPILRTGRMPCVTLSGYNDSGRTFVEIAALIEKGL
jgi:hypothetical protein